MKTLSWVLGIGITLVVAGVVSVFLRGYRLPPVKIIKPTEFTKAEEIGAVLVRRFWPEVHDEKIVILGQSPFLRQGHEIWRGFMRTLLSEGVHFDRYFYLRELPVLSTQVKFEEYSEEAVRVALENGQRVLIHHIATDESVKQLTQGLSRGLVLFQAEYALSREKEAALQAHCLDEVSEFQLGCAVRTSARPNYRKRFSEDKLIAALDKYVPLKQILFVHEPSTD